MQPVLEQSLLAISAILVSARLLGAVAVRLRQPRVGGEMLAGLLVGAALLSPWRHVNSSPHHVAVLSSSVGAVVDSLGQIGVILYLCLVGLKFPPHEVRRNRGRVALLSVPVVLGALALAPLAVGWFAAARWQLAGGPLTATLILATALMVNGFPVVALVLQERGMLDGTLGATLLGTSALLAAFPFLIVAVLNHRFGSAGPVAAYALGLAASAALVVIAMLSWPRMAARLGSVSLSDSTALALAAVAVVTGAWLSSRLLDTGLPGGFAVGVALSRSVGTREVLEQALGRVVPVILVPVFFAAGGIRVDPRVIDFGVIEGAALFTMLLVAVAALAGWVSSRVSGITTRDARMIAGLLNCRGLVLIALSVDMVDHRLIGPRLVAVFCVGALVTTLMTGPLLAWADRAGIPSDMADDKLPVALTSAEGAGTKALARRGSSSP
jgi:Kef-type K+ transport system membrane component KefB